MDIYKLPSPISHCSSQYDYEGDLYCLHCNSSLRNKVQTWPGRKTKSSSEFHFVLSLTMHSFLPSDHFCKDIYVEHKVKEQTFVSWV